MDFRLVDDPLEADGVVDAAREVFLQRCAVCSTGSAGELSTARWRPMLGAIGADGRSNLEHYWWLAFEWSNVVLLCSACNGARGRRFPTRQPRAHPGSRRPDLEAEDALLLDPTLDDYETSFLFDADGVVSGADLRSSTTIEIFALNRPRLVSDRKRHYAVSKQLASELTKAVDAGNLTATVDMLRAGYEVNGEHYEVRRQAFHRTVMYRPRQIDLLIQRAGLDVATLAGDLPRVPLRSVEEARGANSPERALPIENFRRTELADEIDVLVDVTVPVAVTSLEIRHFRGIDHLELEIPARQGGGDWLMLIGENGVGKTSVLQAIALALAGPSVRQDRSNLGSALVQKGHDRSWLRASGGSVDQEFTLELPRWGKPKYSAPHLVAVAGYGAMRLPRQGTAHKLTGQAAAVGTLFDPHGYVRGAGQWIREIGAARRDAVAAAVSSAFQTGASVSAGEVYFTNAGRLRVSTAAGTFAIEDLSSGQQVVAALVLDIARTFIASWESLKDAEGIVLVDELEAHLHPRWQLHIVDSLRQTFPRLQFICTTHNPLCLRGLRSGEVRVLRASQDGALWVDSDVPDTGALTADQLLTSEIFGLSSTLDPALDEIYREYYRLLSLRARSKTDDDRLSTLRRHLEGKTQFGQTRREAIMLRTIDEYIARDSANVTAADSRALSEELQSRLHSIWEGVIHAKS